MVNPERLQEIYEEVKTPFKYGIVVKGEDGKMVDSPSVFHKNESWFMLYLCMNDVGYETHLARSDDLLSWERLGKVLSFPESGWDRWQLAGGIALMDHEWGTTNTVQPFEGKYWLSYLGGALQGYETDPLSIGIATTDDPTLPREWNRYPNNPVLTRDDIDVRAFEKETLYRSNIIWDHEHTLGHPFVMFYNGKEKTSYEKIGMAVSNDMVHWKRFGDKAILSNGNDQAYGICGDPQVVKIGDLWVMFYFGAFWKPGAFDTLACSYDLVNWTPWEGEHLVQSSKPFDEKYAHKPWLLKHDGVVYHFYCAVGDQGRCIALATSVNLRSAESEPTNMLLPDTPGD